MLPHRQPPILVVSLAMLTPADEMLVQSRSDQTHRQRQLNVSVPPLMTTGEVLEEERDVPHLQIAAPPYLWARDCPPITGFQNFISVKY
jgi:hypothetical protein